MGSTEELPFQSHPGLKREKEALPVPLPSPNPNPTRHRAERGETPLLNLRTSTLFSHSPTKSPPSILESSLNTGLISKTQLVLNLGI